MFIPIRLDRDRPLQRQIYEQVRDLVLAGRLHAGARMPSSRVLADRLSVSRITVLLSYERLIAEGLLETRPASGTFVSAVRAPSGEGGEPARASAEPAVNDRAAASARVGQPDAALFPAGRWQKLMRGALDRLGVQVPADHPAGNPALRAAIAEWLSTSRRLQVAPEQIIVTSGRQQAVHLVAHLTLRPGARLVVEDPCDPDASASLASESAPPLRVPVDADGLCVDRLPEGHADLLHVTPEHQRPLGVMLSRGRRMALLGWANRSGATVLEEDCDGELHYGDTALPSLACLDPDRRVILLGGFCLSLGAYPGLAYLVLPHRLVAPALAARRLLDDARPSLEAGALAEFVASGEYARHLHRLTRTYAARREALLTSLREEFGQTRVWGGHAGLHLAWLPPPDLGSAAWLATLAGRCGLEAAALPAESRPRLPGTPLLLGFGALSGTQIAQRVARFATTARINRPETALSAD